MCDNFFQQRLDLLQQRTMWAGHIVPKLTRVSQVLRPVASRAWFLGRYCSINSGVYVHVLRPISVLVPDPGSDDHMDEHSSLSSPFGLRRLYLPTRLCLRWVIIDAGASRCWEIKKHGCFQGVTTIFQRRLQSQIYVAMRVFRIRRRFGASNPSPLWKTNDGESKLTRG